MNLSEQILIDPEDAHLLSKYSWRLSSNGYVCAYSDNKKLYLHRLIVTGSVTVDHKNKNKLDNRRANLRAASYGQNNAAVGKRASNTTGHTGVTFRKDRNRYQVMVANTYVGSFSCINEAALAYNKRALLVFGEFAQLNEVTE